MKEMTKEVTSKDEQFEQQVKASLDADVEALDADTRKRLAGIRLQTLKAQALNAQTNNKVSLFSWLNINNFLPAGALVLASLFAVFLVFNPQNQEALPLQNDQVAVFELLDNTEELDAITDADFYVWLDENLNQDLEEDADTAS
jgi:hypothetical protein